MERKGGGGGFRANRARTGLGRAGTEARAGPAISRPGRHLYGVQFAEKGATAWARGPSIGLRFLGLNRLRKKAGMLSIVGKECSRG